MHPPIPPETSWRGEELFDRLDWTYALSSENVSELEQATEATLATPLENISSKEFTLPDLGETLHDIQHALEHRSGVTRLTGLNLEKYDEPTIERMLWGMMSHLGTAISQSATGERIFHVRDAGLKSDDARARGPNTRKRLSFHTDRCDVIGFLCVQPAIEGGENFVVSSGALFEEIGRRRPDLQQCLMQPFLYKRHTVDTANALPYCRQPIFSFCEERFACSFLRVLIDRAYATPGAEEMTDLQREALDFLEQVAEEPEMHVRFFQQRGDILLLNNWSTLHRRSEFVDAEDPSQKRHLLRFWLSVPNSRPLDPLFVDNFGAVEAGAIRGGMRSAE